MSRGDRDEVYISVAPRRPGSLAVQLESLYEELEAALEREGAGPAQVLEERLFLGSVIPHGIEVSAHAGRGRWAAYRPARWMVVEPPAEPGRLCELQAHAVVAHSPGGARVQACEADGGARAVVAEREDRREIHLANVLGPAGGDFPAEAAGMFEEGERVLRTLGAGFQDVVRTWIHLADIGRDYAAFNRARRGFFERQALTFPPASTAIGGAPQPRAGGPGAAPRLALSLHAVAVPGARPVTPLSGPTLNEAPEYGSDFSRGARVADTGGDLLHVSGTAAVDEEGRSVAPGDFERQVERTVLNIRGILAGEGADFGNLALAVTYLKDRRLLGRYREQAGRAGLLSIPHAIVEAEICRPELLCEVEAVGYR